MANLSIEVPDDLVRKLEGIAAEQHKSIEEVAVERLSMLVEVKPKHPESAASALLRTMREPPHLSAADVDELDAAIAAGRLPIRTPNLFPQ